MIAAVLIFREAWQAWQHPRAIALPFEGIGLNAAPRYQRRLVGRLLSAGRRLRSIALEADGRHLMADVVTSAGIAIGMILAVATGRLVLDPLLAGATGLYVLWSGMRMISTSVSGLMDTAPEPAVMERIKELVATSASGRSKRTICAHGMRENELSRFSSGGARQHDSCGGA